MSRNKYSAAQDLKADPNHCPLCKRAFDASDKAELNKQFGIVTRHGVGVHLTQNQMAMFEALHKAYPGSLCRERLFIKMFGYDSDLSEDNIKTHLHFLRKKLKLLDIKIVNVGSNRDAYWALFYEKKKPESLKARVAELGGKVKIRRAKAGENCQRVVEFAGFGTERPVCQDSAA